MLALQCYQWLKEKIISEEGRKQQGKLKDLSPIAERLGCTLPQLAVGGCLHSCHLQGCSPSPGLRAALGKAGTENGFSFHHGLGRAGS